MKKIITFLGTGTYEKTIYKYENFEIESRFVQEAISKIVGNDVEFLVALTAKANEENWRTKDAEKPGLKEIFDRKNISYKELYIKDGHNDQERWEHFDQIFENIKENDEIYVDVTHSFRSTPFIIMAVLNYAKFVKNIEIKGIYYGAYIPNEPVAEIVNLSIFNLFSDWTIAAEKLITIGDSRQIGDLIEKTINPVLKSSKGSNVTAKTTRDINRNLKFFSNALYTVRGCDVSQCAINLKKSLNELKKIDIDELKPFEKILDKMTSIVENFTGDLINDIVQAVKVCIKFNLIQQGYTFLEENIFNFFCNTLSIDVRATYSRMKISRVLNYIHSLKARGAEKTNPLEQSELDIKNQMYSLLDSNIIDEMADLLIDISQKRNDINHAGYRNNRVRASSADKFANELGRFADRFEKIIGKNKKRKMYLIFSHHLTDKQIREGSEVLNIDEYIHLPEELQSIWSNISPDSEDISNEVNAIIDWLEEKTGPDDVVLVQGDFGATYKVVSYLKSKGIKAVYSTTRRDAEEEVTGDGKVTVKHVFSHEIFREYL